MSTPTEKMARKLERLGDEAENWNYHENAEFLRALADAVRGGKFNIETLGGSVLAPDAEKVLKFVASHIEVGR